MLRSLLFSLAVLFMSSLADAEYRAFQLRITNIEKGTERTVTSTLDHIQYPEYHPLNRDEKIEYLGSWMCWGNSSGFKTICPNPATENGY